MCKSPKRGPKSKWDRNTFLCKAHFLLTYECCRKFCLSSLICSRSGSVPGPKKGKGRNRGHAIQLCLLDDLVAPSPPIKMLARPGLRGSRCLSSIYTTLHPCTHPTPSTPPLTPPPKPPVLLPTIPYNWPRLYLCCSLCGNYRASEWAQFFVRFYINHIQQS